MDEHVVVYLSWLKHLSHIDIFPSIPIYRLWPVVLSLHKTITICSIYIPPQIITIIEISETCLLGFQK